MAKIKFLDHLVALSTVHLFFEGVTLQKDRDGKTVAIFQLETPIPTVRSSQEHEFNGQRRAIVLNDVTEVKVHEENMNDDFTWDPDTNTGEYKGTDLQLDVSKKGQTWLVKTSFATMGQEMVANNRRESLSKIFGEKTKEATPAGAGTGAKVQPAEN